MITIRTGRKDDLESILGLIKELADYERSLDKVANTVDQMIEDGFGKEPVFKCLVAEDEHGVIHGTSIYYYRYSTWFGRRLYLEDLVVTAASRGTGIGKKLFEETIAVARKTNCTGMMWQVLDWNEPAINFYKKYDARFEDDWINCHLDF